MAKGQLPTANRGQMRIWAGMRPSGWRQENRRRVEVRRSAHCPVPRRESQRCQPGNLGQKRPALVVFGLFPSPNRKPAQIRSRPAEPEFLISRAIPILPTESSRTLDGILPAP